MTRQAVFVVPPSGGICPPQVIQEKFQQYDALPFDGLVFDHSPGKPADLWDKPFWFDIRPYARPGRNVLTVRVHNSTGPGGLWRDVKLFSPKAGQTK